MENTCSFPGRPPRIAERTLPHARTDSGSAQQLDRRGRNEAEQNKRRKTEGEGEDGAAGEGKASVLPAAFSKEEIAAEDRRPKRKVAVMIGYSGSGYKGMQM